MQKPEKALATFPTLIREGKNIEPTAGDLTWAEAALPLLQLRDSTGLSLISKQTCLLD